MKSIKKVRVDMGLTQLQLANLIHCDPTTVSNWERGIVTPTAVYLYIIEKEYKKFKRRKKYKDSNEKDMRRNSW